MSKLIKKFSLLLMVAVIATSFDVSAFAAVSEGNVADSAISTSENQVTELSPELEPGIYCVSPCSGQIVHCKTKIMEEECILLNDMSQTVTFRLHNASFDKSGKWWFKKSDKKKFVVVKQTDKEVTLRFKKPGSNFIRAYAKVNGRYECLVKYFSVYCPTPVYKTKIGKKKGYAPCAPVITLEKPAPGKKAKRTKIYFSIGPDTTKKVHKQYSQKRNPIFNDAPIKEEISDTSVVKDVCSYDDIMYLVPQEVGETTVTFKVGDKMARTFRVVVE